MPRHQKLAEPHHYEQIAYVITLPRACDLFHVSRASVLNGIYTDRIAACKEGHTWLISFDSLLEYYRPGFLVEHK